MSAATPSPETVSLPVREMLVEYVQGRRLAEIIYQDTNGQVCLVHENIRDVLSRAGHDFLVLGSGKVLGGWVSGVRAGISRARQGVGEGSGRGIICIYYI